MEEFKKILITGGAGFIGGALIRNLLINTESVILNIDKFGYASDLSGINSTNYAQTRHKHLKINLVNKNDIDQALKTFQPNLIIHLAAESHVDRSISNPLSFIDSNILGTFNLLESSRNYWENLNLEKKNIFRFHHVSTDEVFGSLKKNDFFNEKSRYSPRSPYSASKACSDHLVRSWHHTYGLPIVITNCSNNYGPYQFPEKLIPLTILKALNGDAIPIYGDGSNERDWLYVEDHVNAIIKTLTFANIGETYCIGGNEIKSNLEVAEYICKILDEFVPKETPYKNLISFVKDRPGHDQRYAIKSSKIKGELKWEPTYNFENGLRETINWYLKNLKWCKTVMKNSGYKGTRLGI